MPEPESGRFRVELEALLANVMLPLAAPAACGTKVTLKLVLQPAGRVTGRVSPLTLKPDSWVIACDCYIRAARVGQTDGLCLTVPHQKATETHAAGIGDKQAGTCACAGQGNRQYRKLISPPVVMPKWGEGMERVELREAKYN